MVGVNVFGMLLSPHGRECIHRYMNILFNVELVIALLALIASPLHGCCAHVATLHA